jgi:NADH-quinone oxidoreductase subunit G
MSDAPTPSDLLNVEVNGVPMKGRKGAMIIHVTDANNAYVPRFCYHDKLPIAANCRMCLVEVEKAPKPMPACATPIAEGMKIFTKSPKAIAAQKATMEFLLINHPLDCPICDQGGECELQDLAVGFGRDNSRYVEGKRVVKDKNLGPLVSTDMTRCIHCTRCVRFGQDVAGIQELGTTGRGEDMEIGTYIEKSVDHELSGNIIDLCPVGALNSKPFRFRARAWEMTQHPLVSPHDGFGTNLYGHVLRGRLMRVVPRPNEAVNETWIADRDRFSYEGIYSDDRLQQPQVRRPDGSWRAADWDTALAAAVAVLKSAPPAAVGLLAHPSSTTEEFYLLNRLAHVLGTTNIDARLQQRDFRDQAGDSRAPGLGLDIAAIERLNALLVIGANLRAEIPMLAHRVRKAARNGTRVCFLNARAYDYLFPVSQSLTAAAGEWPRSLAGVLVAALAGSAPSPQLVGLLQGITPTTEQAEVAAALKGGERKTIWLGAQALRHEAASDLRLLARELAAVTGATLGELAEGANAVGAALAGALPHRDVGGTARARPGLNARQMTEQGLQAALLLGMEPSEDMLAGAGAGLQKAKAVVAITAYDTAELRGLASVLLPAAAFGETSGTYVNLEGRWQSFAGATRPLGESRPAWKILRVLGSLLGSAGFDFQSSEDVRNEVHALVERAGQGGFHSVHMPAGMPVGGALSEPRIYRCDALVRRASSLQHTRTAVGV